MVNIHNVAHCEPKKEPIRVSIADYMPIWDKEERKKKDLLSKMRQSVDEMKHNLLSIVRTQIKNVDRKLQKSKKPPQLLKK